MRERLRKKKRVSGYVLGRAREWNLGNKMRKFGYVVFRMPQSKGGLSDSKVKPVDLVAMRDDDMKPFLIQVSKYLRDITREEIDELVRISKKAGAEPLLAYIHNGDSKRRTWHFQNAETGASVSILPPSR